MSRFNFVYYNPKLKNRKFFTVKDIKQYKQQHFTTLMKLNSSQLGFRGQMYKLLSLLLISNNKLKMLFANP